MAWGTLPKITWGAAFANVANFGVPLDEALAWSEKRAGFIQKQFVSGIEDAYDYGDDQLLSGVLHSIPTADVAGPPEFPSTGWDGSSGIRAMLSWLQAKNIGRWYPDKAVSSYYAFYLVEPTTTPPGLEPNGQRSLTIKLRTIDGTPWAGY